MIQLRLILCSVLFAASGWCVAITSPISGSELDVSRKTTVTWSFNSSDPSSFNVYLINDERVPSIGLEVGNNVTTELGSYIFDGVDVLPGSVYVFDFKDVSTNGILAQSDQFTVVSKGTNTTTVSSETNYGNTSSTASSTNAQSTGAARKNSANRAPCVLVALLGALVWQLA